MSRKDDLENTIRGSYKLVSEYEDIRRLSSDPKEQARARRTVEEQQDLVRGYLAEYIPLCRRLNLPIPQDIAEIAIVVGVPLPSIAPIHLVSPESVSSPSASVTDKPAAPLTPAIDPDNVNPTKLRQAMHSSYDRPAFEILCKELGLDYHDLRGETLETKMLYLIDWHQRRRRYAQLVRKVLEDHPYLAQELQ